MGRPIAEACVILNNIPDNTGFRTTRAILEVDEDAVFAEGFVNLLILAHEKRFSLGLAGRGLAIHIQPLLTILCSAADLICVYDLNTCGSGMALAATAPTWDDETWRKLTLVVPHSNPVRALLEIAVTCGTAATLADVLYYGLTSLVKTAEEHTVEWGAVRASSEERIVTRVTAAWLNIDLTRVRGVCVKNIIASLEAHYALYDGCETDDGEEGSLWACGERLDVERSIEDYGLDDETPLEYRSVAHDDDDDDDDDEDDDASDNDDSDNDDDDDAEEFA